MQFLSFLEIIFSHLVNLDSKWLEFSFSMPGKVSYLCGRVFKNCAQGGLPRFIAHFIVLFISLLIVTLLHFSDIVVFINWTFGQPAWSQSTSAISATAFDLFVLLCSILVILTVLQTFFFIIVMSVMVISDLLQLQKDFVLLKAEIMVRSFLAMKNFKI